MPIVALRPDVPDEVAAAVGRGAGQVAEGPDWPKNGSTYPSGSGWRRRPGCRSGAPIVRASDLGLHVGDLVVAVGHHRSAPCAGASRAAGSSVMWLA